MRAFAVVPATSVIGENPVQPAGWALIQSYPNPFNPATVINYTVAAPSGVEGQAADRRVRLSVYDLLGREVAVLVDEEKSPGVHTVTWDATGRPSGIYFCRLTAGTFVQTRKLMLLR